MLVVTEKFYRITTNSHHRFRRYKNLINDKKVIKAEQVWLSDISYIGGRDNSSYLA